MALAGARTVNQASFGAVPVLSEPADPTAFVIELADTDAGTASNSALTKELLRAGAAVAVVGTDSLQRALEASHPGATCLKLFGDIETLARLAERAIDMTSWRPPVILGLGNAGTAAYLVLAQAPPNTLAGAVSVGPPETLHSKLPFCAGAPVIGGKEPAFAYGPVPLPGRWTVFARDIEGTNAADFVKAVPGARLERRDADDGKFAHDVAASVLAMSERPAASIADLPLVELPAPSPQALAIFYSGDGGWRDIDKQIGELLSKSGVAVVGVDSLRYFWSKKDPATIAADITRIVDHYRRDWNVRKVSLIGYSFGAAVLPMAWPKLDPKTQDAVTSIILLGIEPVARLQMSMAGWLGLASSSDIDLRPYLALLPKSKVMCFYSVGDKESGSTACTLAALDGADRVERGGGHHFGGDYAPIAQAIAHTLTAAQASP